MKLREILSPVKTIKNRYELFIEAQTNKDKPPLETIDTSKIKSMAAIIGFAEQNPDEVLKKQGVKIYDEMENKDTHLYSVYQTRKLAIAMVPWDILPADDSERSKEIAEFVFTVLADSKGPFSEDIKQILDAIGKGFSILEIVWKLKDDGRWKGKYGVEELLFHKQRYWFFKDKRWHKADEDVVLFGDQNMNAKPIPWERIIHYAYDPADNLYGRAAFRPCYWFYWFKKEGWKSWIVFLNKYGTPTAVGKYPDGAKPGEKTKLLEIIETIQEETGIIIPESMAISFLEASHVGTASYRDLADACNAEISKAILGATQTVEEGRRGSYALSRAHSEVRRERVEADAVVVSDVIQQQLIKRLVDFNFVTEIYPQFIMKPFKTKDTERAPIAKIPTKRKEPSEKEPTEEESPEKELPEEVKKAFEQVKTSVIKNYEKKPNRVPVINVGPIKNALTRDYEKDRAFSLAKSVKEFLESRIQSENVEQTFAEAVDELAQEVVR
ncbi:MAG: DUF935 family protein [Candidatus Aminicenantes bacterium]|nr:MAG: DUF935 family protein [Candidatus Aminicenantes bacterium]